MIDNTPLLDKLFSQGTIRLHRSSLFHQTPSPLPSNFSFDKVEGMLLGAAIGDSLGATSEGRTAEKRHHEFGEIRSYLPGKRSNYQPVGVPTDDTQLTYWTLKQLIRDDGLIPDNLAKRFCKHHIMGIGGTTKEFIRNYKDKHEPWYSSGLDSLGNGALMRISPIVVPYLRNPNTSMYADAALDSMLTHNSYANNATCVAYVHILWKLLAMTSAPEPSWWVKTYSGIASLLEGNGKHPSKREHLWKYTETAIEQAFVQGVSVREACAKWGNGAGLFETVPPVLYILAKHAHKPEEAIVRAVNDTYDNDTIGSIVGAAVGALHGLKSLPARWIEGLTGRTRSDDDGQVFKLIMLAKKLFWLK